MIPARFASVRFPGKALAKLAGKPIIQHVYERARQASLLTGLVIATDDPRIQEAALRFGAPVCLTRADHVSGTDRVAEVAGSDEASIVVNIQGDEPMIEPATIDAAARLLIDDPEAPMATLMTPIGMESEMENPNVVKAVADRLGNAIYFSRWPIPYDRGSGVTRYKHIGLYAYRRAFLLSYSSLPIGPLETAERLEQLRAIENGYRIRIAETKYDSVGVDTPEDLDLVARLMDTRAPGGVKDE